MKPKQHLEFVKVDLNAGWEVPPGYPPGFYQKILASDLDEKNKKDSQKMEQKKKQMAEDDEAYRKWIDEFEKITKRPSSVSPPPAVASAKAPVSASSRAPAPPAIGDAAALQASVSTPELDPAQFPKYQQQATAGGSPGRRRPSSTASHTATSPTAAAPAKRKKVRKP